MNRKSKQVGDEADLRRRAERVAGARPAVGPAAEGAMSPEAAQRAIYELHVHQVELKMQCDELRRTQAELESARAHYFALYDLAPVGYVTVNEHGLIQEANLTAAVLLGTTPGTLVAQPVSRFVVRGDQDIWFLHRRKVLGSGQPATCELRMARGDGTEFWVHLASTVTHDGGTRELRLMLTDDTERRNAIQALMQRNEELDRWNRAAVGRELVMIGLKRQVNALSLQLGLTPPFALDFAESLPDSAGNAADPGSPAPTPSR